MGARQNETSLSGFLASEVVQTRRQMEVDGFDRALWSAACPWTMLTLWMKRAVLEWKRCPSNEPSQQQGARNMPRLDPSNAAQYPAPSLGRMRGKNKLAVRNADDGEPAIWYWQVTGGRWDRDGGKSWNSAHVAWNRLCGDIGRPAPPQRADPCV